jgi:hypothetical protein
VREDPARVCARVSASQVGHQFLERISEREGIRVCADETRRDPRVPRLHGLRVAWSPGMGDCLYELFVRALEAPEQLGCSPTGLRPGVVFGMRLQRAAQFMAHGGVLGPGLDLADRIHERHLIVAPGVDHVLGDGLVVVAVREVQRVVK